MRIEYLDGERLRRSLIAGCEYVQEQRAELNRINVFPVPDGDTGTNLALTVSGIADHLRRIDDTSIGSIARHAADSAILGARGNCGMILSHFLLGFSRSVGDRDRLDVTEFADSLDAAVRHVYASLEKPVEGTIITVMREVAEEARASEATDFADLIEILLTRAHAALDRTPDLLPVLRAAGVVDAGAKGFVHLFEGIVAWIRGDPFVTLRSVPTFDDVPAAAARVAYPEKSETYRFCTEALVRGDALPTSDAVRDELRSKGDSLIVIRGDDVLKLHIHTDEPDAIFSWLRTLGRLVTHKAEDMAIQHAAVERAAAGHIELARRPMSILVDSAANLPDEVVRAHGIHVVPMLIVFENEVLRDGIDIDAAGFVKRLLAGERPTTSQPAPAAFIEGFRRAAEDGEVVLAILVGSKLSGTLRSAEAAARHVENVPIRIFDSRAAGLTQGLLALRAAELAESGTGVDAIVETLERVRARSGVLLTVETFDNLLASGRVGRGKVMIAGLLDIKPVLTLSADGQVVPLANVRGAGNVVPRMLELVENALPPDPKSVRFGLMRVGASPACDAFGAELRRRYPDADVLDAPVTSVIATHLGPGAWGIAWMADD